MVAVYEISAIILSLITLSIIFINATTQVAYGLGTQFSLGTYNYTGLEQNTRAFLNNLQQQRGPPIYTLLPEKARAVLSGLQASVPVEKLPAVIENRTIPGGPGGKDISITTVRPANSSNQTLPVMLEILFILFQFIRFGLFYYFFLYFSKLTVDMSNYSNVRWCAALICDLRKSANGPLISLTFCLNNTISSAAADTPPFSFFLQ